MKVIDRNNKTEAKQIHGGKSNKKIVKTILQKKLNQKKKQLNLQNMKEWLKKIMS